MATSAAFAGTPLHASDGRAPAPSQVNCLGITPPFLKSGLRTASGLVPISAVPVSWEGPPEDPQPTTATATSTAPDTRHPTPDIHLK
jgi:hypothetical protein